MKATEQTRRAADLIEILYHDQGITYQCKCGHWKEANAYSDADYEEMIRHANHCMKTMREETSMTEQVALEKYGERAALTEMMYRIKHCVPNGNRLSDIEVKSLAQVSIATGLNPFTGEIWYIPKKGPMAGIKGLRRRAREQSTYSVTLRAMRNGEMEDHNIKPGDVGRICELFRHDVLQKAVEINRAAGEMVVPVKPLLGIGIWRKGDQIASSKSSTWMANKRAEADALRQGFDLTELQYSDEVNGSQIEFMETAGGWSVAPEEGGRFDGQLAAMREGDEAMHREAAHNAERHAEADEASEAATAHFDPVVIAGYQNGELELPPWAEEIREAVKAHPQASDSMGPSNGTFITQLTISAGRKVTVEQFRAFVQIVLGHPLDEVTFGEASVLMDAINAGDFKAKVIGLLS